MGAINGAFSWLLESLPLGLVLLDEEYRILFRNQAAVSLDNVWCLETIPPDYLLAIKGAIRRGESEIFSLGPQAHEVQLLLSPPQLRAQNVHAALLLRSSGPPTHAVEHLQKMFSLTTAESRLVRLLLRGDNLKRAAAQLEVSTETVRSQLKSVFAKTNTRRQAELILLLSRPTFFDNHAH
jgi:DNA-binding CsgD family transcriptional regulator